MKFVKNLHHLVWICLLICLPAEISAQEVWKKIDNTTFELNSAALGKILSKVSKEKSTTAIVNFPDEKGNLSTYKISDHSVLPESLSIKYPGVHAYRGVNIDNPNLSITLTCNTNNVATTLINGTQVWSLEQLKGTNIYILVNNAETIGVRINCSNKEPDTLSASNTSAKLIAESITSNKTLIGDNTLRILRTAVIVDGEYSEYFINKFQLNSASDASKISAVLGAIVTSLNNLNAVFERDLGVRFQIIENNDELIFLNPSTDPFTTNDPNTLIDNASDQISAIVGLENIDIGHFFSGEFQGLAEVASLCQNNRKAKAISGTPAPEGTSFDFTLLAHEFGHQLGANHTQNYSCAINTLTSVEPGSGSTIMGYAGISCQSADDEVQTTSDEYFHYVSINQIKNHIQSVSCGFENIEIDNNLPVIEQLPNYTIPVNTNFILEANTTDADNDALTYCWEQLDNEIADQNPPISTSVGGPLFRSFTPTTSPSRKFPQVYDTNTKWEVLPTVSREMNFGLTVRDGNPSGIATSSLTVNVVDTGEKFEITAPNGGSFAQNSTIQVEWNVAGTNTNGINTESVTIELSYDNGETFPVVLAQNTPNDGVETVLIPSGIGSTNTKIKITPINNIYYTISNSFIIDEEVFVNGERFEITEPTGGNYPQNSIMQVEWNLAVTGNDNPNLENVTIELSYDNGVTYPVMLAENTPNDGVERIIVPADQTTSFGKIRITTTNGSYFTLSPNNFNIIPEVDDDLDKIPNPVEKNILIKIFNLQVPEYEFTLYDMTGKLLISKTLISDPLISEIIPVNISILSRGMYIMKLVVGSQIYTRKIVKL